MFEISIRFQEQYERISDCTHQILLCFGSRKSQSASAVKRKKIQWLEINSIPIDQVGNRIRLAKHSWKDSVVFFSLFLFLHIMHYSDAKWSKWFDYLTLSIHELSILAYHYTMNTLRMIQFDL